MKKIILTIMCVALIATVLTACGSKNKKNENVTEEVSTETETTTEVVKKTEEPTQVTTPAETKNEETTTEEIKTTKAEETSSVENVTKVENNTNASTKKDTATKEDAVSSNKVTETKTTYTEGPFTFEMPTGKNSYVAKLEAAGLISKGQLDGTYIDIDERGNFIIFMPGTGSGEVYDIGNPNEDGNMTPAQEKTFNEVYFGEFNNYESGKKSGIDLNGDGIIEKFENYICAAATCGLNLKGSISDIEH